MPFSANTPDTLITTTISTTTAAIINVPTHTCSFLFVMGSSEPASLRHLCFADQHLQVIEFVGHLRLRHSVQKLADARMLISPDDVFRSDGGDVAPIYDQHAIGDQPRAG